MCVGVGFMAGKKENPRFYDVVVLVVIQIASFSVEPKEEEEEKIDDGFMVADVLPVFV